MMREVQFDELRKPVRELVDDKVEEVSAEELERRIETALTKPAVVAVVIFPQQQKRQRFPIPPRRL